MSDKQSSSPFLSFFVELCVPMLIYVWAMPKLLPNAWGRIVEEPWPVICFMYLLAILMGACWINAYNCIRIGLFYKPPESRS